MRLEELRSAYLNGLIEKKLYWEIARDDYTHILTDIQKIVENNPEVQSIEIRKDGIVLKKTSGVSLFFDFCQSICRAEADILLEGDPEKDDMAFVSDYISEKTGAIVFDVGANVGIFSLEFCLKQKNIDFYLFEPVPSTYRNLLRNAKLNMDGVIFENYHPFNIGMSDKKGEFEFWVPASNEAASLIANEDAFYRKKSDESGKYTGNTDIDRILCDVSTIDDFVDEHGIKRLDFIKIDVEGNEKNVLKGARHSLLEYRPLVYCELLRKHAKRFGYHPNEVISYMSELGYSCKVLHNGELKKIESITDETMETNFFFES